MVAWAPQPGPMVWVNCPIPCSEAKTSLQISVWTAIRSNEGTLIAPPPLTLCPGMSSSCQLRSRPFSARRSFRRAPIQPAASDPFQVGPLRRRQVHQRCQGRTTRDDTRESRAAIRQGQSCKGARPPMARIGKADQRSCCASPAEADSRKRSASIENSTVVTLLSLRAEAGRCAAASPE